MLQTQQIVDEIADKAGPWMWQMMKDNLRSDSTAEDYERVLSYCAEVVIDVALRQLNKTDAWRALQPSLY
jgi:hypothetical protein